MYTLNTENDGGDGESDGGMGSRWHGQEGALAPPPLQMLWSVFVH